MTKFANSKADVLNTRQSGLFKLNSYTNTTRDKIANIEDGLTIYNSEELKVQARVNGVWIDLH